MKKPYVRDTLSKDNALDAGKCLEDETFHLVYEGIVMLLAEVLDATAAGENVFITVGSTRNKDAFILTVNWDGTRAYASGKDLKALSSASQSLLMPSD